MSSHDQNAHAQPRTTVPEAAAETLADRARALRIASGAGLAPLRLMRKNVGLLCAEPGNAEALTIHRAAAELGAHVSLVHPRFDPSDAATMAGTGRILDRLYDAVVCVGLAPELVAALRRHAQLPVLDEACVAGGQGGEEPDGRLFLWQAALIGSLA